jgi:DNA-directed RNA polymerase specialized sigma24 family protein
MERERFAALMTPHTGIMLRAAAALVGPPDAEDAVQEALLHAWRGWDTLPDEAAMRAWLLRITANVCHNWQAGHFGAHRRRTVPLDGAGGADHFPAGEPLDAPSGAMEDALARSGPGSTDHASALDLRRAVARLEVDLRQVVADRLAADGAAWRAALPTTAVLDAYALTLVRTDGEPNDRSEETLVLDGQPPLPLRVPPSRHGRASVRGLSRLGRVAGVAAMAAVVILFAGVYTLRAPGTHRGNHAGEPTATPGVARDLAWQDQRQLQPGPEVGPADIDPVVSPSDPRVVYEANSHPTDDPSEVNWLALRRTDDGGATWHDLPVPVHARITGVRLSVSPRDAHTVFLELYEPAGDQPADACPAVFHESTVPRIACQPQYRSTDGGATWTPLITPDYHIPGESLVGLNSGYGLGAPPGQGFGLRSQGERLYSTLWCPPVDPCVRIVASDDGGVTWRFVDDAVIAQGMDILDYAVAPSGATIFAIAGPSTHSWRSPTQLSLWRSDDGGATWRQIGPLPTPHALGLLALPTANSAQPLLYLDAPRITGYATNKMGESVPSLSYLADDVKVSTDGGSTWQSAPTGGASTRLRPIFGLLGTLADGSIVVGCVPDGGTDPFAPAGQDIANHVTLYAWRLGDPTWRQLASELSSGYLGTGIETLVITHVDGHEILWATNRVLTPRTVATEDTRHAIPPQIVQDTIYHVWRFQLL